MTSLCAFILHTRGEDCSTLHAAMLPARRASCRRMRWMTMCAWMQRAGCSSHARGEKKRGRKARWNTLTFMPTSPSAQAAISTLAWWAGARQKHAYQAFMELMILPEINDRPLAATQG